MQPQTLTDLQFVVTEQQPRSLPVEVALALLVERPIRSFRVLDLETPEGWAWVEFRPWRSPDPVVPAPLTDYGHELFERYGPFFRHVAGWSPRLQHPEVWSREARRALENFEVWLAESAVLPPATADWLLDCLWRLWATPQGPQRELQELARREAETVRRRRDVLAQARAERDRKRRQDALLQAARLRQVGTSNGGWNGA